MLARAEGSHPHSNNTRGKHETVQTHRLKFFETKGSNIRIKFIKYIPINIKSEIGEKCKHMLNNY